MNICSLTFYYKMRVLESKPSLSREKENFAKHIASEDIGRKLRDMMFIRQTIGEDVQFFENFANNVRSYQPDFSLNVELSFFKMTLKQIFGPDYLKQYVLTDSMQICYFNILLNSGLLLKTFYALFGDHRNKLWTDTVLNSYGDAAKLKLINDFYSLTNFYSEGIQIFAINKNSAWTEENIFQRINAAQIDADLLKVKINPQVYSSISQYMGYYDVIPGYDDMPTGQKEHKFLLGEDRPAIGWAIVCADSMSDFVKGTYYLDVIREGDEYENTILVN